MLLQLASVLRGVEICDDCKHARQQLFNPLLAVQRQGGGGRLLRYRIQDTGRQPKASWSTNQTQLLNPLLAVCTAAGWGGHLRRGTVTDQHPAVGWKWAAAAPVPAPSLACADFQLQSGKNGKHPASLQQNSPS